MFLIIFFQLQESDLEVEAEFISEIDKIQKPLFNINDSLYKFQKFDLILRSYRNPKTDLERFVLAEAYYYKKNYKDADVLYSEIIRNSNDSQLVAFSKRAKAWILYHFKLYQNAIENAQNDSLLLSLSFIKLKNYANAYNISRNFENDTFLFISGFSSYLLKNYDFAISSFEKLYQNYPNSSFTPYGLYRIGFIYFNTDFYDKAVKYFSVLIKNYPNFPFIKNALYLNAYSYYKLSDYEQSYEYLLKLIKNYPNDDITRTAKNLIKEIYLARPEIVDKNSEYYDYLKAYKLYKENKCNSAIEVYKIFLNSKQKTVLFFFKTTIGDAFLNDTYFEMGNCYKEIGNYKSAIDSYKKCKLNECKYELAISLYLNGDYPSAIREFEKLLKDKNFISKIPEIYYYIGLSYLKMNKRKVSEEYLNKAKALYLEAGNSEKVKEIESLLK
ncbi:MAG: tetratricopeptide repeat protein [candidate division WOR-3 bacterium]